MINVGDSVRLHDGCVSKVEDVKTRGTGPDPEVWLAVRHEFKAGCHHFGRRTPPARPYWVNPDFVELIEPEPAP
jgi:hypothetical protein